MCSTFKFQNIVGRNFDYDISYKEELKIINQDEFDNKYKIMGMGTGLVEDYPLLYDGMNEWGLCCSALAFEGNAIYNSFKFGNYINVPSFKVVFFILSEYASVKELINDLNIWNISNEQYSDDFPNSDLHWFIADKERSIILEQTEDGLNYYDGEVMTNNPPYNIQERDYKVIKQYIGKNDLENSQIYKTRGLETIFLTGDYTSMGRFERLSWLKEKLENSNCNFDKVSQSFHLLSCVEQIYGATPIKEMFEYTIYSIIYDMNNLKCYVKRYDEINLEEGIIE